MIAKMNWGFEAQGPIQRAGLALAMLIASATVAGCSSGDGDKGTIPGEAGKTDYVNGALLATIGEGTDHRVEFYDFGYGIRGCREMRLEKDASWFAGSQIDGKSLTELYQILRPQAVVPQAIREADARALVDLARIAAADPKVPITKIVSAPPNVSPAIELRAGEAEKSAARGPEASGAGRAIFAIADPDSGWRSSCCATVGRRRWRSAGRSPVFGFSS